MIVVIGAGPAGLSAAYHTTSDCLVLEQEEEAGGLCRSFTLGDAVFDLGGHAFFSKHDYVHRLAHSLSQVGLCTQPRRAWVYSHGTYVPYPFQANLYGLPPEVVAECLDGLPAAGQWADEPAGSLLEWIGKSFGDGISRHFLVPYNEKQWAYPLDEIAPEGTTRIVSPDVESIVTGAGSRVPFRDFPNVTVSYPASGGFANVWSGFLTHVGDRLRYARVEAVDLQERTVTTADGERISWDRLVSTMPLSDLIACASGAPAGCGEAVGKLRHNSLHLVNIAIGRQLDTDMQRVYVADPTIPFHKLVLNSNSSPDLRGRTAFALQAEISWSPHKPVAADGLEERVVECLVRMGIIERDETIAASSVVTIDYAYPVYTHDTAAARSYLLTELERFGIVCAGRFGEWLYINSDDAVLRGKRAAERSDGPSERTLAQTGSAAPQ